MPIDGKGCGVVATRKIRPGERIAAELPLATLEAHERSQLHIFDTAVRGMDAEKSAQFWRLSQAGRYGSRKTARGVWLSNAYPRAPLPDGTRQASVYAYACRMNHSCVPNAHVGWSARLGRNTVHAISCIIEGEEVVVSYLDVGLTQEERRSLSRRKFGFECLCTKCGLIGADKEASDVRQRRLVQVDAALARADHAEHHAHETAGMVQTVPLVEERMRLLAAEGLPVAWAYSDMIRAFTQCCKQGEYERAMPWIRRAINAAGTLYGDDSKSVRDLREIADR